MKKNLSFSSHIINYKDRFKDAIINNKQAIWKPKCNIIMKSKNTDSWFDIKEHTNK